MSRPHALKRFVTAVVLVSICSAVFISTNTRARAANPPPPTLSTSKISPDLRQANSFRKRRRTREGHRAIETFLVSQDYSVVYSN